MRVAVFGATGTIGNALLPLLARRHDVVAVSRRPHEGNGVNWAVADATDEGAVRRALDGVEVAYYLVHSLGASDFEERDLLAARTVAQAAEQEGVRQLVYLGGLGDDSPDLSPHLRSRLETAKQLAAGSVPVTTLRAAIVVGPGSAGFETIVALVDRLPAMVCPRWVGVQTQPIALADVIRYLEGVCGEDEARGESFDVGGPEVMTYREMIERIARLRGKRRLIVEIPALTPRLSSYWLHLVTPVKASVARPLIEGLRNPTVAADDRIRDLVQFELTPFDDAARAALGRLVGARRRRGRQLTHEPLRAIHGPHALTLRAEWARAERHGDPGLPEECLEGRARRDRRRPADHEDRVRLVVHERRREIVADHATLGRVRRPGDVHRGAQASAARARWRRCRPS